MSVGRNQIQGRLRKLTSPSFQSVSLGQEAAAVISSRENRPETVHQPDSGCDWEGRLCRCETALCAPLFRRIVSKTSPVQVISSVPMRGMGLVEAFTESLSAAPLEEIDRSLLWGECWVVAELSHPAFCSARNLTACSAMFGGHALDVVEGLTVRLQCAHVEMLQSFRSAVISEVASSLVSLAGCEGRRVWRAPSCQYQRFSG